MGDAGSGPVDASSLAELCASALPGEHLTAAELARITAGPGTSMVGDGSAAAVFDVKRFGEHVGVWLLLVAVEPRRQGRGSGTALVERVRAEAAALGAREVHVGNCAPRYVWPGLDATWTQAGGFFESVGLRDGPLGLNMAIPATYRRPPPPGVRIEREVTGGALAFARRAYPQWEDELGLACEAGTAFAARDVRGETVGFGCHSVLRAGWIGPMATEPGRQHGGVGSAVLAAVCADLDAAGVATGEIAWVSTLRFYGKCGATVSRVFRTGTLPTVLASARSAERA